MQQRTARIYNTHRAQFVAIPREFMFLKNVTKVLIRKLGDDLVLSPQTVPMSWGGFFQSKIRASDDFMAGFEDLPLLNAHEL